MANYKEYKCDGCGYVVAANPKGKDMVMMGETETFLCSDCKEIVDVFYPHGEKPEKLVCPDCGGRIIKKTVGFGCENFKADDPQSCKFFIGKMFEERIVQTCFQLVYSTGNVHAF